MIRRWQYPGQAFYDPGSLGDAEVDKTEQWYQPLAEPVRRLPGVLFAAALVASGAVYDWGSIGDAETVKLEDFFRPFSEPVLPLPRQQPDALTYVQHVAAVADTSTEWWVSWPEQTYALAGLDTGAQQFAADDHGSLGDAETVKLEDFFRPLSEPIPPPPPQQPDALTYVQHVEPAPATNEWFAPWPEQIWAAPRLITALQPYVAEYLFVADEKEPGAFPWTACDDITTAWSDKAATTTTYADKAGATTTYSDKAAASTSWSDKAGTSTSWGTKT